MRLFSTYSELSTPPHLQWDSSPTDFSTFAEANLSINELIQAMARKTNVLDTSELARPSTKPKSALGFHGNPLAMELFKPKRKRIVRTSCQPSKKSNLPRGLNVTAQTRDKIGHFGPRKSAAPVLPTESSTMDTTPTPASSIGLFKTEFVSPALPSQVIVDALVQVDVADSTPASTLVLDANSPLISSLTFPMPTAEELASFLYSNYLAPKLFEYHLFFLCREQFYNKFYYSQLISFFQYNLGSTCISFFQVDTIILCFTPISRLRVIWLFSRSQYKYETYWLNL